jgi:hypothetical protein
MNARIFLVVSLGALSAAGACGSGIAPGGRGAGASGAGAGAGTAGAGAGTAGQHAAADASAGAGGTGADGQTFDAEAGGDVAEAGGPTPTTGCALPPAVASCYLQAGATAVCEQYGAAAGTADSLKASCPASIGVFSAGTCPTTMKVGYCVPATGTANHSKHYYGDASSAGTLMSLCAAPGNTWCPP